MSNDKLIALINVYNELTKRVGEYYTKEAQYTEYANSVADQIVTNLREANLLSDEQAEKAKQNLVKSGAAALDMLNEVAKSVAKTQVTTIGTPYAMADSPLGFSGDGGRYVEIDGIIFDKARFI